MPALTFVGTGEAFDPELPNTSLLYEGARAILLDCGYGVPHAFWRITRDPSYLDAIYISHLHADHTFGLPALLLWMRDAGRTRPLDVIGGPDVGSWLERLLELGYPGSSAPEKGYPIRPIPLEPGGMLDLGPVRLSVAQSRHSVLNLAVRLEEPSSAVCYSGDGAPTEATRRLYDAASVLVHECYAADRPTSGHARLEELLDLKSTACVQTLCLLHLGREEKALIRGRAAGKEGVLFPSPGSQIHVGSAAFRFGGEWL